MKKIFTVIFLYLFASQITIVANMVVEKYFSEIQFRESGWIIELYLLYFHTQPDSVYLTTKNDTAFLKPDCLPVTENGYFLITNDSLTSSLTIDPTNDTISLYLNIYDYNFPDDQMVVGNLPLNPTQSFCRQVVDAYTADIWYIDNSPTLGSENDTENALGIIHFQILDDLGIPIDSAALFLGVRFDWSTWGDSLFIYTDSLGKIIDSTYACYHRFLFMKNEYTDTDTSFFVAPDSVYFVTVTMQPKVHKIEEGDQQIASQYYLSPAYPNPFNNTTNFTYRLPAESFTEISVYSLTGTLVATLFKGYHYAGEYSIQWNAADLPSGIYIINMTANQTRLQRKCILLK